MQQLELLTYGKVYHIYNHGINHCDLFKTNENYTYFLNLYDKHLSPIADTLAWVLMKNHIHLLVKIKENKADSIKPYQSFSNLFNAYAKLLTNSKIAQVVYLNILFIGNKFQISNTLNTSLFTFTTIRFIMVL